MQLLSCGIGGTPAEVDGLSNGGAVQKERLECLYIISLLRRPLIFLQNAKGERRATRRNTLHGEKLFGRAVRSTEMLDNSYLAQP